MAMFKFESVLVTGANRGLGLEFIKQLSASPQLKYIFATCRSPEGDNAKSLRELATKRSNVTIIKLDSSDKQSIENSAVVVKEKLADQGLDLIINNAGIEAPGKLLQVTNEDLIRVYHTNVIGPLNVIQAYHSLITNAGKRKGFAAIINMSSWLGSCAETSCGGMYPYGLSKAAMNRMTRALSYDLIDDNVITVSFHPGWVKTDLGSQQAPLTVEDSIKDTLNFIQSLDKSKNGTFYHANGNIIPW
ncbi:putative oxidoreductase [Trichoplax sp. H2]|uniref:Uncharacterized protein n=1 Tax=Trichoplax adhaerens TaxID=10228 RepID=B3RWR1_TRIAD|nr:hypothetical protein TRIADDRAFT_56846 [Trichoplax adhaerens]EDV25174.1 hypothetical protein TRIADDRAFT_56846 [Trichoplax adhaerens]RDD41736.1 putative oxidoreductase [Trichoplax sp. H2]|eukprot:XP_002113064.1 hypothetical protein TRIADDRAFT_56846 [Trichoplax adhaerens]